MKESYIAAKERWARKMAGQQKPAGRTTDRRPAGQRRVHRNGKPLSIEHGGPVSFDGETAFSPGVGGVSGFS